MTPTVDRRAGAFLFFAVSVFLILFGLLHANVSDLLTFHAAAVPPDALDKVRPLDFALMKLIGGASIGLGVLGACVVLVPMRPGAPLAAPFVSVANWIALAVAAQTAIRLADQTGAQVTWTNMAILASITALGVLAHLLSKRG
jgi:hypothetical protein